MSNKELKKILYAEDEADIKAIAQIALEDLGGFQVKYCANGWEAIQEASVYQPDLILLDVMMPVMDGPSALKKLRSMPAFSTTPAIFMTAKVQANEVAEYKELGVLSIIKKPFDPMTLAETIREAWNKMYEK